DFCYAAVFFQAEDGIRDRNVTGVQTCALPISDPNEKLGADVAGDYTFYTFDDKGEKQAYTFTINADDSLNDVLTKITEDDNNVRAFYDKQADKVVFETTRTGNYNTTDEFGGAE